MYTSSNRSSAPSRPEPVGENAGENNFRTLELVGYVAKGVGCVVLSAAGIKFGLSELGYKDVPQPVILGGSAVIGNAVNYRVNSKRSTRH